MELIVSCGILLSLWSILLVGEYFSNCGAYCQVKNIPLIVEHIAWQLGITPPVITLLTAEEYPGTCGAYCQLGNIPIIMEHVVSWLIYITPVVEIDVS